MQKITAKLIDFCLYNEEEIKKAIADATCEVTTEKVGNFYGVGNPVEAQAYKDMMEIPVLYVEDIRNGRIEPIPYPQRMLKIVDKIWQKFKGTPEARILEMRYISHRTQKEICEYGNVTKYEYYDTLQKATITGEVIASVYF